MDTYLRVQSERPLIIRTGPGFEYSVIRETLAHDTVVIMEEKTGSWVKHYKGWSQWSDGAFAYYTPRYRSGSRRRSANTRTRRTPSPQTGYIARLDDRGFGFIRADRDGADIFFHCSSVVGVTFDDLRVNDPVEYSSELDGQRGKPRAVKVTKSSTRSRSERKSKPAAKPATSKSKAGSKFRGYIDQKVQCRDSSNQEWMTGTIVSLRPTLVKVEGSRLGRQWEQVREWVPLCSTKVISTRLIAPSSLASAYSTPATSESGSSIFSEGNSYNWRTYVQTTPKYNQKIEKYVTLTKCVVQESVDPRSTRLRTVPEGITIQIDSVCKERARMISPYKGWLWMSSPRGPLVQLLDFHPLAYDNHVDFESEHHVLRQPSHVTTIKLPCVIRADVNCQSAKLCTLPVGTLLTVESVYKQRAYVHANLNGGDVSGWCWLASPSGDLVKLCPVNPTVVLTGPMVNDDDIQTTRNCLAVYGIQIVNITPLDTMTVELEVRSHRDGKLALKHLREVNGKPVKLAWKKSYVAYREQSVSTRV